MNGYRMPFGKYRGTALSQLPSDYLIWLNSLDDLREPLCTYVRTEYRSRFERKPIRLGIPADLFPVAEMIIDRGFRSAAKVCHPDTGGSHEQMLALVKTAELLKASLAA